MRGLRGGSFSGDVLDEGSCLAVAALFDGVNSLSSSRHLWTVGTLTCESGGGRSRGEGTAAQGVRSQSPPAVSGWRTTQLPAAVEGTRHLTTPGAFHARAGGSA
jgi:hypothetical protein